MWKKTAISALAAALSGSAVLFANSDGQLNRQNASLVISGALVGLVNFFLKSPIASPQPVTVTKTTTVENKTE